MNAPAPAKRRRRLPETVTVAAAEWAASAVSGSAVVRGRARDVLVKGALPGESVTARVVGRRRGRILSICEATESPSAQRVDAPCAHFPRCGGCALQHLRHRDQLTLKTQTLRAALAAAGVRPQRIEAPVAGPQLGYRRRARLGVRRLATGEVCVGFRESFGSRVAKLDHCMALAAPLGGLIGPLRALLGRLSCGGDGIPQIELAAGDGGAAAVIRHLRPFTAADIARLRRFGECHGVQMFGQAGGYDTIAPIAPGATARTLAFRHDAFGLCFEFEPWQFVQVNREMNEKLIAAALAGLRLAAGDRLLDLFCGLGNFSLAAARLGARVTGIDNAPEAIARAERNAQLNGLTGRASFRCAELYAGAASVARIGFDKAILDPPRLGAGAALSWLPASVRRIAYASCNPATFAEDAATLARRGFECRSVRVFDMFPQTAHLEALGLFQRPTPSPLW